jgi:lipid IVA palmitoyltransferase
MKRALFALFVCLSISPSSYACDWLWSVFARPCNGVAKAYRTGDDELLLSGWAHHDRRTYTPEKIAEFNERAWGIGYGKTAEDPDGDTHMLYWLTFRDSKRQNQWQLGYAYNTYWGPRNGAQVGLGYTAFIAQRPDIFSGVPFPAILPMAGLKWNNTSLNFIFIPRVNEKLNNGNVLYAFVRHNFK